MNANIFRNSKLLNAGLSLLIIMILWNQNTAYSQSRTNYFLPDIPGLLTLKGDFHIHTPFSDGSVWPSDRVREAWRDGLDILALTDHIEYSAYSQDVNRDLNRPYEIAKPVADELGIILIKGAEITRSMPPGHFNAYFLKDINALKNKSVEEVFKSAAMQGAYFEWNHPGWKAQQPDTTIWFPMHTELYNKGYLNGIEVFNESEYYPIVQQWAIDKNLSIFANSDSHAPVDIQYNLAAGNHRPMTLIFAKERTLESIREAMTEHRTAVLFRDTLIGNENLLIPLIDQCLRMEKSGNPVKNEITFIITNISDFPIKLQALESNEFKLPNLLQINGNSSVVMIVKNIKIEQSGFKNFDFRFKVLNALKAPYQPIEIGLHENVFCWKIPEFVESGRGEFRINGLDQVDSIQYFYTLNGEIPTENSIPISVSFRSSDSIDLKIAAFYNHIKIGSTFEQKFCFHKATSQNVRLAIQPNQKYSAQGSAALTDGIIGSDQYGDGKWLGFEGNNLEAIITLKDATDFTKVEIGLMEANKSWIFLPKDITVLVSADGINFIPFGNTSTKDSGKESNRGRIPLQIKGKAKSVKYIKFTATNQGVCPSWHSGAGKACWLFVDEIMVR